MSLHSAPFNLTRFPSSACIGYSSRLWCAMHPFLAIPYAVACAFVACMPISRHAAIPHPCAPLSLALSIRRASSTFPRMQSPFSGGFRTTAALRSPLSISRIVPRSAFACPIVKEQREPKFATMEINANKSTPRPPNPRFYWRFRIFTVFLREANRAKSADWRGDA